MFARYIAKEHGGLLRLGRHKGMWFNDVWKTHPDYCEWAAELEDPGDAMKRFSDFAKKKMAEQNNPDLEEPPKKKSRESEDQGGNVDNCTKFCVVCMTSAAEAAFVPCGGLIILA